MSKPSQTPVTVVIPTWNAAIFVERVLALLVEQSHPRFEIVVVDNGVVNSETEEVCARWKPRIQRLRYLRFEKQLGYAGAVNEGARAAAFELVAVINNDNLPEKDWLAALVEGYEAAKAGGVESVQSSHVHRADFADPFGARLNLWGRIVRVPKGGLYVPFHPDGSSFLFSREALGLPYDPDYFIYHEDVALGWRAWLQGIEVRLCERSKAATFDGGSTRRIRYSTAYYSERNRWLNLLLFLGCGSLLKAFPLLFADACLTIAGGSQRRAKLHAWASLFFQPWMVLRKRAAIQAQRKVPDAEILPLLSGKYADSGLPARMNSLFAAYAHLVKLPLNTDGI